jgi:hypothetical protein
MIILTLPALCALVGILLCFRSDKRAQELGIVLFAVGMYVLVWFLTRSQMSLR